MRFLLDTNIISDLVRNPHGTVAGRIVRVGESNVCTSIIVAAELRYGAAKKRSIRLAQQLEDVLRAMKVLPLQAPADAIYGDVRAELENSGQLIGPHDLLIAAHAIALGCIVVTNNEREFSRVKSLQVENWIHR